jgi:hypothetical protein
MAHAVADTSKRSALGRAGSPAGAAPARAVRAPVRRHAAPAAARSARRTALQRVHRIGPAPPAARRGDRRRRVALGRPRRRRFRPPNSSPRAGGRRFRSRCPRDCASGSVRPTIAAGSSSTPAEPTRAGGASCRAAATAPRRAGSISARRDRFASRLMAWRGAPRVQGRSRAAGGVSPSSM